MRINNNISAMITQSALYQTTQSLSKSLERLSTGLRINRASDDAAGLGVSENLRTQVNGTSQASKNAQDGIAALNVAEGAANEVSSMLQRMRELAVQSANDTLTST
jgi:flagellin